MKKHDESENSHERARRLIDKELIEGLPQDESRWLADHVATCESCAHRSSTADAAVSALKSVSVQVPRGLAASTTLRVREKATKLKAQRTRNLALITGWAVSWVAGVASAPLVWKLFEWVGATLDLPKIVWQLGFLSWWFVPASCAGLVLLWVNARTYREELDRRLETEPRSNK